MIGGESETLGLIFPLFSDRKISTELIRSRHRFIRWLLVDYPQETLL